MGFLYADHRPRPSALALTREKNELSSEFRSLFDPAVSAELVQQQPAFLTQIFNLAVMNPRELNPSRKVEFAAFLMKMVHHNFRNLFEGLVELLKELIKNSKAKEVAMTVAEYFETKGQIQGRQEGEQIGMQKERFEMARRLKSKGLPIKEIAEVTGLTEEEVKKL